MLHQSLKAKEIAMATEFINLKQLDAHDFKLLVLAKYQVCLGFLFKQNPL